MKIRDRKITIRCTNDEKQFLYEFSKAHGCKVATVIREALNEYFNKPIMEME